MSPAVDFVSFINVRSSLARRTQSATLINAPWVFSKIWALISGFLTEVMRNKVSIQGSDWKSGKFQEHSSLKLEQLPSALGGEASDACLCMCLPVHDQG